MGSCSGSISSKVSSGISIPGISPPANSSGGTHSGIISGSDSCSGRLIGSCSGVSIGSNLSSGTSIPGISPPDTEEGAVDLLLNSATEVKAERNSAANNFAIPTINVFVVSFREMCNVQRGVFTWEPDDTSKQQDITEFNPDLSIIKSGQMYGIANCDGIEIADTQSAFFEHVFIDNNTIQLERYATTQRVEIHWEVLEFISV